MPVRYAASGFLALVGSLLLAGVAEAQTVVVYDPVISAPTTSRVIVQSPVVVSSPTIVSRPITVFRPAAPTILYSPVISGPVATAPIVSGHVVQYPTIVSYPPTATYLQPTAVTVGRPVIVRSKVYVPGQPIRNFFKAITP